MCAQDSRYEEDKKLKQDEETFGTNDEWMNPGNVSCAMKLCKERKKQKKFINTYYKVNFCIKSSNKHYKFLINTTKYLKK